MEHLLEHPHAFVRKSDNRVVQVAIFDSCDADIDGINNVVEGDTFAVSGCTFGYPPLHGTFDGTQFIPADADYLISIGLLTPVTE